MSFTISTFYINTKGLKDYRTDAPSQSVHPDLAKWCKRYDTTDTSLYKGKRIVTHRAPRGDNPYHAAKDALLDTVRDRIDAIILKVLPNYDAGEEDMYYQTRTSPISRHRLGFMLAAANLCDAIVDRKWRNRETAFYHLNTHYLGIMRELYGKDVKYKNHEDVACTDHFIPEGDRFYGKRRKKKA